jgi:adenylate cyclase
MHSRTMSDTKQLYEELWYWYLTGQNKTGFSAQYEAQVNLYRLVSGLFPGQPRCLECNRPLFGLGSRLARSRPSSYSPRLCNDCEVAMRQEEAGAEVELSLLFADVRGSTTLAERTTTDDYKKLIQRFYQAAGDILIEHNALVNRLMGDQVIGLFVSRFAGAEHAKVAVAAALDLLRATGHADRAGPWIPVGIGIHTGLAYVGAVGSKAGVNEIAVLGSAANLAARLSSQAAQGEVFVSEAAAALAELAAEGGERRQVDLKGVSQPVTVRILRV